MYIEIYTHNIGCVGLSPSKCAHVLLQGNNSESSVGHVVPLPLQKQQTTIKLQIIGSLQCTCTSRGRLSQRGVIELHVVINVLAVYISTQQST